MGTELERTRNEAGTSGAALLSAKAEVHRIASDINGLMERFQGTRLVGGTPPIEIRLWRGGRGPRPRGYMISWMRQRDKGTGSLASSKSFGAY